MTLENFAVSVASRISSPDSVDAVSAEVRRIARGESGSNQLVGEELLIIAGLIVQVCTITIETAKIVKGFHEQKRHDQLLAVLNRLAESTGDPAIKKDENVNSVAAAAIDALDESQGA